MGRDQPARSSERQHHLRWRHTAGAQDPDDYELVEVEATVTGSAIGAVFYSRQFYQTYQYSIFIFDFGSGDPDPLAPYLDADRNITVEDYWTAIGATGPSGDPVLLGTTNDPSEAEALVANRGFENPSATSNSFMTGLDAIKWAMENVTVRQNSIPIIISYAYRHFNDEATLVDGPPGSASIAKGKTTKAEVSQMALDRGFKLVMNDWVWQHDGDSLSLKTSSEPNYYAEMVAGQRTVSETTVTDNRGYLYPASKRVYDERGTTPARQMRDIICYCLSGYAPTLTPIEG